ncbi:MAG: hypothetical protein RLZZ141_1072, partial [Pseudomonadota bacterium]
MRRLFLMSLMACTAAAVSPAYAEQPHLEARSKPVIQSRGLSFKDLNANGRLDPYEDWRVAPERR